MSRYLEDVRCPRCRLRTVVVLTHQGFVARAIKCRRLKCGWRVDLTSEVLASGVEVKYK